MTQREALGLPQFKDVATSDAYMDHQIRFAISPMTGFDTPKTFRPLRMSGTWPTSGGCDRLFRCARIEDMETNTAAETNGKAEIIVGN